MDLFVVDVLGMWWSGCLVIVSENSVADLILMRLM